MNPYPLFHRKLSDNSPRPSAHLLGSSLFTGPSGQDATQMKPSFYEFFAGGGMARAGLGDGWEPHLRCSLQEREIWTTS